MKIQIKPTMNCNLRCYYCNEKKEKAKMSMETVSKILEYISDTSQLLPQNRSIEIEWTGGEPFLMGSKFFYNVFDIQNRLIPKEVINTIYTNLLLLDNEMLKELANNNKNVRIYTSLDDLNENKLRKGCESNYFAIFDSKLQQILKYGISVKLYTTVTKYNVNHIKDIYQYCKKNCIDYDVSNVQLPFNDSQNRLTELSPHPIDFINQIIELFNNWYNGDHSVNTSVKPLHAILQYIINGKRQQPTALLTFDSSGGLHLCPFHISKNVAPYRLLSDISGNDLLTLSSKHCATNELSHPKCIDCFFEDFCKMIQCKNMINIEQLLDSSVFDYTCQYWKPIFFMFIIESREI